MIKFFYLLFLFSMLFIILNFEINKLICILFVHLSSIIPEKFKGFNNSDDIGIYRTAQF